jgi:hypothetical protein
VRAHREDLGGLAVHIGARNSTVNYLAAGWGTEFDDRATHVLKGVPDEWRLFAIRS